tara:strand:+ start:947 stop:1396 length:450 start_codon:yes stop_codon:yes gene_type:complete
MSSLVVGGGLFFGLTLVAAIGVARLAWVNYKRFQINEMVSDELQVIIEAAQQSIKAQRELTSAKGLKHDGDMMDLHDPVMLSTLITVIVYKHGTLRLTMKDFDAVPESEYISVYVDTTTNELILSLNHDLGKQDPILANFTGGDDTTFH